MLTRWELSPTHLELSTSQCKSKAWGKVLTNQHEDPSSEPFTPSQTWVWHRLRSSAERQRQEDLGGGEGDGEGILDHI